MTAKAMLDELRPLGRESYKKVMLNHGVPGPFLGVTIEESGAKGTLHAVLPMSTSTTRSTSRA